MELCRTIPWRKPSPPILAGFRGDGPVRIGNAAVDQIQHDTFGSIILAATPMFFDQRLPRTGDESLFTLLESLGHKAEKLAFEPDAGIWEYRGRTAIHTYSAAMCWAGCSRLAAIAAHLGLDRSREMVGGRGQYSRRPARSCLERETGRFHRGIRSRGPRCECFPLPEIGLIDPNDPRLSARSRQSRRSFAAGST